MSRCVIDVGGVHYETTDATRQRSPTLTATHIGPDGVYFVDRDGLLFSYILQYLRIGRVICHYDPVLFELLRIEAGYYGLPDMVEQLRVLEEAQAA